MGTIDETWLDTDTVALLCGLSPRSVTTYTGRTRRRIAAGEPLGPRDFPLPDMRAEGKPLWKPDTIARYRAAIAVPAKRQPQNLVWIPIFATEIIKGDQIKVNGGAIRLVRETPIIHNGRVHVRTSRKKRTGGYFQTLEMKSKVQALRPQ